MKVLDRASSKYEPSELICRLRQIAMDRTWDSYFDHHRNYFYMEGWMSAKFKSLPIKSCSGMANVLRNIPVAIEQGEIIVGEHGNSGSWVQFCVKLGEGWTKYITESTLTDEQKAKFIEWCKQEPFQFGEIAPVDPPLEGIELGGRHGVTAGWGGDLNHSVRDYEKFIRLGFGGLKDEIQASLDKLTPHDPFMPTKRAYLLGLKVLCEGGMQFGLNHAVYARKKAKACKDPVQKQEWLDIAEVCEQVPAHGARTFREACQALWFGHMITVFEDGVNANSIGRLDQFLWPYLEADLEAGRTTWEEAAEVIAALWVKLYQPYDVQQATIGGQHPDGTDASNPLSYLILDVTENIGFVRCLSCRVHRNSPQELLARCVDLLAKGGGIPFFFNDEAIVPALVAKGIPIEDARQYAIIGCIEITIPGKTSPHAVSHWINLLKCLELAMNDGRDFLLNEQVGPKTGTLAEFKNMDDLTAAYTKQLTHFADLMAYFSNRSELMNRYQYRLPFLSLLTEDCIARGMDIVEGGAKYNYHSSAAMAIPNVADSFAAIEKAVFTDKTITGAELLEALKTNFDGKEDLCLYLRNKLPKYGNDEPLPDKYATEITRQYCDLLSQYKTPSGGSFHVHLFTFTLIIHYGKSTGASADGRLSGEPLAYSLSPMQGRDHEGFTAVVNSLAKIPHDMAAASSSAILEADPKMLEKGHKRRAFVDLLTTAIKQGVGQMQFNVCNAETLKAAQDEPENYRNLFVRISGFSQQFILQDRQMQDHIIARTKHKR
jgi:formate C-acetyltransferase